MVAPHCQVGYVHGATAADGGHCSSCVMCWADNVNVRQGSKVSHVTSVTRGTSCRKESVCVSIDDADSDTHSRTLCVVTTDVCVCVCVHIFASSMWWWLHWRSAGRSTKNTQPFPVCQNEQHCHGTVPPTGAAREAEQRCAGERCEVTICCCGGLLQMKPGKRFLLCFSGGDFRE